MTIPINAAYEMLTNIPKCENNIFKTLTQAERKYLLAAAKVAQTITLETLRPAAQSTADLQAGCAKIYNAGYAERKRIEKELEFGTSAEREEAQNVLAAFEEREQAQMDILGDEIYGEDNIRLMGPIIEKCNVNIQLERSYFIVRFLKWIGNTFFGRISSMALARAVIISQEHLNKLRNEM